MAEIELEGAKRLIASTERAKENIEKARTIIEAFYGLKTEYGTWYEDITPPAVEIVLLSPTNQRLLALNLSWDEEGYVNPNGRFVNTMLMQGWDEVKIAIKKLAPWRRGYNR